MPKLLLPEGRTGWSAFHRLLISLLKFLAPFIRTADLQNASRSLFCGVRRLLLVLLHDFPEFLAEYYFTICDVLPPCCIQLRNVVLSAYRPKLMLPDPHLVDMRAEMGPVRPVLSDYAIALGDDLMADRYSLPLINALTLYVGASSVVQAKARTGTSIFIFTDLGRALFLRLATDLDIDGQHHLMSAIVTHLRYPSAHTQWFGSLALFLFAEVKSENFAEVTTKVLLERFIVHCPHPWGALVTFIELLRNPKYDFWSRGFVRLAPEITTLLESVSRSIVRGFLWDALRETNDGVLLVLLDSYSSPSVPLHCCATAAYT
ncbi:hypothetical protein BS47DRAFT_1365994 [Hydnum rufescens UP504]|uniref:CCR4-Not complex component Not1 C-terminal domain-containing protein n=1 Tax=Hydnum rufescens UP504 TaxID=1448309 RepID=A0A9P6AMY9_9AGAM|nr:hypothetical protein BS47DRAFT_1365994 [Hydnum rufescens UP504]